MKETKLCLVHNDPLPNQILILYKIVEHQKRHVTSLNPKINFLKKKKKTRVSVFQISQKWEFCLLNLNVLRLLELNNLFITLQALPSYICIILVVWFFRMWATDLKPPSHSWMNKMYRKIVSREHVLKIPSNTCGPWMNNSLSRPGLIGRWCVLQSTGRLSSLKLVDYKSTNTSLKLETCSYLFSGRIRDRNACT